MRHTTHKLSDEQKKKLYKKHKDLIYMIHTCGDMILRKQIKRLYHMLHPDIDEATIEFDIAELICSGFLLQKQIQKPSRTQMLYLSKYPRSYFYDNKETTGDIPALNFTTTKIYKQIFIIDYLIAKVIPDMKTKDLLISMENINAYLIWSGSNLLCPNNVIGEYDFYTYIGAALQNNFSLSSDFFRDLAIAENEMHRSLHILSKKDKDYPICKEKQQRDMERDSYTTDHEKNKYFYNLKNFNKAGFIFEEANGNTIKIAYFDSQNNIQIKKLWIQLSYILLMFQRYLNSYDIEIEATIYLYDEEKREHLIKEENTQAYDFYRQEMTGLPKKHQAMKDIGIKVQFYDCIHTNYKVNPVFENYNIQP